LEIFGDKKNFNLEMHMIGDSVWMLQILDKLQSNNVIWQMINKNGCMKKELNKINGYQLEDSSTLVRMVV